MDYARLVLTRFVVDASPAAFAATNAGPRAMNGGVLFRDVRAPARFVERVESAVTLLEAERRQHPDCSTVASFVHRTSHEAILERAGPAASD